MASFTRASPIIIIPVELAQKIADRFRSFVGKLLAFFPTLRYDLRALNIAEVEAYAMAAFLSSLLYAILFGIIVFIGLSANRSILSNKELILPLTFGVTFIIFFIAYIFNMICPGLRTHASATKMSRELTFALKDMLVQIESGIPLYEAMINIAQSNYGDVSVEFSTAVKNISAGLSESSALQKMALKTKSEYFRKALWQFISSLESGASLGPALRSVIETLESYQHKTIKEYAGTLNFIVLIYMLTAAAIPSIGMTFLVIFSAFGGAQVNEQTIMFIIMGSLFVQLALIGYANSSRPIIYM